MLTHTPNLQIVYRPHDVLYSPRTPHLCQMQRHTGPSDNPLSNAPSPCILRCICLVLLVDGWSPCALRRASLFLEIALLNIT